MTWVEFTQTDLFVGLVTFGYVAISIVAIIAFWKKEQKRKLADMNNHKTPWEELKRTEYRDRA